MQGFSRWNEGTIFDGAVINPNLAGCNVTETISVYNFPLVQGSLQFGRKVALDQIAYENESRCLKSLKILRCSASNEGTIGDGAMNYPNPIDCHVIENFSE